MTKHYQQFAHGVLISGEERTHVSKHVRAQRAAAERAETMRLANEADAERLRREQGLDDNPAPGLEDVLDDAGSHEGDGPNVGEGEGSGSEHEGEHDANEHDANEHDANEHDANEHEGGESDEHDENDA